MSGDRYAWIDNLLREWVAKCNDTAFLAAWRQTIDVRIREIERRAELTLEEIVAALDKAEEGDVLFPHKRVRIPWDGSADALREIVYLVSWNAEQRVAIVRWQDERRKLDASELSFYQIATRQLHVRRAQRMRHLKIDKEETET